MPLPPTIDNHFNVPSSPALSSLPSDPSEAAAVPDHPHHPPYSRFLDFEHQFDFSDSEGDVPSELGDLHDSDYVLHESDESDSIYDQPLKLLEGLSCPTSASPLPITAADLVCGAVASATSKPQFQPKEQEKKRKRPANPNPKGKEKDNNNDQEKTQGKKPLREGLVPRPPMPPPFLAQARKNEIYSGYKTVIKRWVEENVFHRESPKTHPFTPIQFITRGFPRKVVKNTKAAQMVTQE
jgi:hypothetical protein